MSYLVYIGIAMHPQAEKELMQKVNVTHDPVLKNQADGVIVYSPEPTWPEETGFEKLKTIACHVCEEPVRGWAIQRGVSITEAASLWRTVAEHTLALLMSAVRNIPQAHQAVKEGKWKNHEDLKIQYSGHDFQNRTLGIWGLGQIGIELAEMLQGFRMKVLYHDLVRNEAAEKKLGIVYTDPETLRRESDYFILLLPLNENTRGILGAEEMRQLKPGCIFVNTARAGIVSREAFLEAMDTGRIGAAALDVQWNEPLFEGKELMYENIIFSPHLGGSTYECDKVLTDGVLKGLGLV